MSPSSIAIFCVKMTGIPGTKGNSPGKCSVLLSDSSNIFLMSIGSSRGLPLQVSWATHTIGAHPSCFALWIAALWLSWVRTSFRNTRMGAWMKRWSNNFSRKRKSLPCSMEADVESQPLVDQPLEFATVRSRCSYILRDEIFQAAASTADLPFSSVE